MELCFSYLHKTMNRAISPTRPRPGKMGTARCMEQQLCRLKIDCIYRVLLRAATPARARSFQGLRLNVFFTKQSANVRATTSPGAITLHDPEEVVIRGDPPVLA